MCSLCCACTGNYGRTMPHITFVLWILQQQIQLSNISADKQVKVTLQRAQVTFNEAFFISLCRWLVEWQLSKDLTWILDTGYWQYVQPTGTNSLQNQLVGKTFFGISVISWMVICLINTTCYCIAFLKTKNNQVFCCSSAADFSISMVCCSEDDWLWELTFYPTSAVHSLVWSCRWSVTSGNTDVQ